MTVPTNQTIRPIQHNNIINSGRVSQIRRSYRIRNLKKVTKYFNKTKQNKTKIQTGFNSNYD